MSEFDILCRNIKTLRDKKGLSIKELSEKCGVSEKVINEIESFCVTEAVNMSHILDLCQYFDMIPSALFSDLL